MDKTSFSKLISQKSTKDTLAVFLYMLGCLAACAAINGYVLEANGATGSIFRYMLREAHFSLILLLPVLLPRPFSRIYSIILYLGAATFTAANWVHFSLYNAPISSYIVSVINESYFGEAYEFTLQFVHGGAIIRILAVFLLPLSFLLRSLRRKERAPTAGLLIALAIVALIGIRLINKDFSTIARWNYMADFAWSCVETQKITREFSAARHLSDDQIRGINAYNTSIACTTLHLAGVSFAGMDPRLDVLSPSFNPQKILIWGKDYTKLPQEQK